MQFAEPADKASIALHQSPGRGILQNAKRRTSNAERRTAKCTVCLWFSSFTHVCLRLAFVC